jgi:predicted nucleotide-binding protein
MTVIEEIEDFAPRAGFARVLMAADDVHYPIGREGEKKHRPRQNAILELGYFAARLGRSKTLVCTKGEVEVPSDVFGLIYDPIDRHESWKMQLAGEPKAAGFQVDLNCAVA